MVYKCSVFGCENNYKPRKGQPLRPKVTLFRFPSDEEERNVWIKSLPNNNFEWTNSKRVCVEHWPPDFPTRVINRNGSAVPAIPPSVFASVPPSCLPTKPPKKRQSLASSRL